MSTDKELVRCTEQVLATEHLIASKFNAYQAAIYLGEPRSIENARLECVAAYETLLDAKRHQLETSIRKIRRDYGA